MDLIDIGFNAARVCEAIARIGYEPHTAIMDLVDNAVTAKATEVKISLLLAPGKSLKSRNSVKTYQIVDNGIGMDEQGIQRAFTLGSDGPYDQSSLSKYGMGLKSAGLSLGSSINIVTKQSGAFSDRFVFDKDVISQQGKFVVGRIKLTAEQVDYYSVLLPGSSGTIVEVEGCDRVNHASPKATIDKLTDRLGVYYFSFLRRDNNPLTLYTRVCPDGKEEPFSKILARDMLFLDNPNFKRHFNPDAYDYASPYLALEEQWKIQGINGDELPPIKVVAVVFPQHTMSESASPLSDADKDQVKSYRVARENKGFYIYRNGRLIRWGDDLEGLIGKDDINIRLRMDLDSAHDDVLHVDVTKQRLEIDDENSRKLSEIISKALLTAKYVRNDCQQKVRAGRGETGEGLVFTSSVKNVAEDDPDELAAGDAPAATQERRKKRAAEGEQVIKQLQEEGTLPSAEESLFDGGNSVPEEFKKVVYSDKVTYGQVWQPFYDAKEGVFVCISKHHPFYNEFLSRLAANSTERVCAEALMFSVGLAESNVRDNMNDLTPEQLDRIFKRLHKNIASWLGDWTAENTSLFTE